MTAVRCCAGVMHRDLKPQNILSKLGEVELCDWNLACYLTRGSTLRDKVGTELYMAPEVFKQHYDHRADVWSIGICAFALLSGKLPFDNCGMLLHPCICDVKQRRLSVSADFSIANMQVKILSTQAS